jgi:hypothetical protein
MRRCQLSFDFLAIVLFTFLLFLALFEVYVLESTSARINEAKISAQRVGSIVARAINRVSRENGTGTQVAIPESLDTSDTYYLDVQASGRRVDVFWPISSQNRSIAVPILTSNVTAFNISKSVGSNQSTLYIANSNGFVNVSLISCGNSVCEAGENCVNCPADCACTGGQHCCSAGYCSVPICPIRP